VNCPPDREPSLGKKRDAWVAGALGRELEEIFIHSEDNAAVGASELQLLIVGAANLARFLSCQSIYAPPLKAAGDGRRHHLIKVKA
jgi:hypothetical protein